MLANLVHPPALRVEEFLVEVDGKADKDGVPGEIGETSKLVQLEVTRGVLQLEIDVLAINSDGLVERLVHGRAPGASEGVEAKATGSQVSHVCDRGNRGRSGRYMCHSREHAGLATTCVTDNGNSHPLGRLGDQGSA